MAATTMRRASMRAVVGAALAACLAVLAVPPAAAAAERGLARSGPRAAGEDPNGARVIVKYKAHSELMRQAQAASAPGAAAATGPQHAVALAARTGLPLRDGRRLDARSQVVRGDLSLTSAALAARLAAEPDVEYAVPDLRRYPLAAPNDPLYAGGAGTSPASGQWYLRAPDATAVAAIDAAGAWDRTPGNAGVVVAVVDTGVRFDHPDLQHKLHAGYDFIDDHPDDTAGDGDGRDADASDPGDFTSGGECGAGTTDETSSWHGTQVAGLIGAHTDNGIGMASVGNRVMVSPLRALGKCGGYDSDIIAAMRWAAGIAVPGVPVNPQPARVVNLSLGSAGACVRSYTDAVADLVARDVVVVAAAGNDAGLAVGVPANCNGVIAVAGLRHVGTKVGYSNVGPEVAVAAPAGNCVNLTGACLYPLLTTTNAGSTTPLGNIYSDAFNPSYGTSFATPLVAGTVALMLSANPTLTPAQVKSLLGDTARTFPATSDDPTVPMCHAPDGSEQIECICTTATCGAGMLDAAAAVDAAAALTDGPYVRIVASASTVTSGTSVTFDSASSLAPEGRTLVGFAWVLTSGGDIATISGAGDGPTATVDTHAGGSFTLQLTLTDSSGAQAQRSVSVTVEPAVSTGGGGGGASSPGWLAGLLLAALALRRARPQR